MIDSISKQGRENEAALTDPEFRMDPVASAALSAITPKLKTALHAFQARGVAWMVSREMDPSGGALHPADLSPKLDPSGGALHPAWIHLAHDAGQSFLLHSYTGEVSSRRFAPPSSHTCGGMLCDDVGLGKSIQVIPAHLSRHIPPHPTTSRPTPPELITSHQIPN